MEKTLPYGHNSSDPANKIFKSKENYIFACNLMIFAKETMAINIILLNSLTRLDRLHSPFQFSGS
jgi:hypothetical protein